MTLRINTTKVAHQAIDGEVIIINLETGSYYSLNRTASELWNAIEQGATAASLRQALKAGYEAADETISNSLDSLLEALRADDLIVESDQSATFSAPESTTKRGTFEAPEMMKYTDMQELLMLDPIHDIDGTGWPNSKLNTPS